MLLCCNLHLLIKVVVVCSAARAFLLVQHHHRLLTTPTFINVNLLFCILFLQQMQFLYLFILQFRFCDLVRCSLLWQIFIPILRLVVRNWRGHGRIFESHLIHLQFKFVHRWLHLFRFQFQIEYLLLCQFLFGQVLVAICFALINQKSW